MRSPRTFSNTDALRQPALHFKEHGYYCDAPRGTKAYWDYWEEQKRRCLEGYETGGMSVTGYHYFYLNFTPILLVEEARGNSAEKVETFPHFWDGDYNYFWALDIAQNGISEEEYEVLQPGVDITDLKGGFHLVVLKARGKGFSYKAGSMLARNFALKRKSKNFALAHEKEYLTKDGLLTKAWDTIDFIDANTPWRQPRLKDATMHKRSGYQQKRGGSYVELGTKNEIMGVSLKDNPDKARGKRGELIFFEEAGKFPGLQEAWEICRPSVEQGKYTTGTMIAYGTGGSEEGDYEDLEELFYNPESYNVQPINNQWDEGADGNNCSFFFPAYINCEGFIDADGNSDIEAAKAFHEEEREKKKQTDEPRALEQYTSENPFNPREATLRVATNIFPTRELQEQLNRVLAEDRHRSLVSGQLYTDAEGTATFRQTADATPLFKYPAPEGMDKTGAVVIKEAPVRDGEGKVPRGLYTVCHDPYAHDGQPEKGSLGAAFVIKRTNNFSKTLNGSIVASYVGRPRRQDDYNRTLFLLADYYNCKIGFENNRGDVIGYAKRFNRLHFLEEEFEILDKKQRRKRPGKTTNRPYGIRMSEPRKNQGQVYLRDWLLTPLSKYEDGETKLVLHTLLDPALLNELIKYNPDGNFDRVSALLIGMYYLKDLQTKQVGSTSGLEKHEEFFSRPFYQ